MAYALIVQGLPGTGKTQAVFKFSYSEPDTEFKVDIKGLPPANTYFINTISSKMLPTEEAKKSYKSGKGGNYSTIQDPEKVKELIKIIAEKAPHIHFIVIDDMQFYFADKFMDKAFDKGYEKWNEIGFNGATIFHWLAQVVDKLRNDLYIICLTHTEEYETQTKNEEVIKTMTAGKMTENYLRIEGLFTTVLHSVCIKMDKTDEYPSFLFKTRRKSSKDTTRSPLGVFPEYINNDFNIVIKGLAKLNGDTETIKILDEYASV